MDSNNQLLDTSGDEAAAKIPTSDELALVASNFHKVVNAIKIDSAAMFLLADEELIGLQKKVDELDSQRKAITKPMDEAKKRVMDLYRDPIESCNTAIKLLKGAMLEYTREQKRIAAEAQAKADETVRQERLRLEALAREEAAAADRQRQEAAAAAAKVAEAEAAEQAALAAGDHQAAIEASNKVHAALQEQAAATSELEAAAQRTQLQQTLAANVSAVHIRSSAPDIKGLSTSAPWTAEVTSLIDLVRHVAAHPEYINFLEANMVPIKQQAKALGVNCKIPGVRAFQEERLSRRRA